MASETCEQLANSLDSVVSQITGFTSVLDSKYSTFQSSMTSLFTTYATGGSLDINSALAEVDSHVNSAISDVSSAIKSYTGSCLDSIVDPILNGVSDIAGMGESLIGGLEGIISSGASTLLSGIISLTGIGDLIESLGISSLIGKFDQIFGCLESASCLPVGKVGDMLDKVNSFTTKFGLTSSGSFDLKSWLSNTVSNIKDLPSKIVNNFNSMITNFSSTFTSWATSLKDKLTSLTSGLTSSISGLAGSATGGISSITGGLSSVSTGGISSVTGGLFSSSAGETTGTAATPIKTGSCDCYDPSKYIKRSTSGTDFMNFNP